MSATVVEKPPALNEPEYQTNSRESFGYHQHSVRPQDIVNILGRVDQPVSGVDAVGRNNNMLAMQMLRRLFNIQYIELHESMLQTFNGQSGGWLDGCGAAAP